MAVITGILVRVNGESLASAVLAGGAAFGGTFALTLTVITVVRGGTDTDG
ncbi:hypothetical protein FF36_02519 [Frankia torreyi]|uniref:Uncharacterized protein n=1 Tax=Frankia torreyi TaxID=1856 RepID=A0A0D8BG09_9ACTN|nr:MULTISPECIES: hypothetical protein [Frankia]KJE23091.1 hypothetical protein FF36_02519 [Frankia torreyi]KQM06613.1 hypothetical protein FF86_100722 [Frankia sp. CpI1-P]